MIVAVINSGSSSIKFKLFDMNDEMVLVDILIEEVKNHHDALQEIITKLKLNKIDFSSIDVIGHRVVHGGEEFCKPTIISDEIIKKIKALIPLAPLHNPANLEGILVCKKIDSNMKQVAVFDTAFHSTMPIEAFLYAIPYEMYEKYKIRRYGFHGTSHHYVLKELAKRVNKNPSELNVITLHLGNGASVCAIKDGKSIDTSMGFTPLEGLVMGTRSGDIDPAIVLYMLGELGMSVDEVDALLNKKSGLLGICKSSDIRNILKADDDKSKLALKMMIRRVKKYIGAYMALLGRVDAIVFTGGIGENSAYIRDKVMDKDFSKTTPVFVIKTDEELEIARECLNF